MAWKKARNGRCSSCGDYLGFDDKGARCASCSSPAVKAVKRAVREAAWDRPVVVAKERIKAHPRCEDAIHCEVCREEMGL